MTRLFALLAAMILATASGAADLDDRYAVIGTMTAEVGDTTLELVIVRDTEKGNASAQQRKIMGKYLSLNFYAATVGDNGRPGSPAVQVTLMDQTGRMTLLSAELFDEQGYEAPMAMGADGGTAKLTSYSFEDGRLEGRVEGEFLRLQDYMSEPKPADGAQPVPVRLTFGLDMPPLEK